MAFSKGKSGNPDGLLPIGDVLKNKRKFTRVEWETAMNTYLYMTPEEIDKLVKSRQLPMIDYMLVSVINSVVKDGNYKALEFLLDRSIGQAVRRIRIEREDFDEAAPKKIPVQMSKNERIDMMKRLMQRIEDAESEQAPKNDVIEVKPNEKG